jgi:aryl-alcohol dehydrogenase-like predicted oxidoreductase
MAELGGHSVPRLGYGTMRLTGPHIFGPPADRDEAVRVLRRAVELGVRVIDTSWYYGPYVANEIVHEALHPYPEDLVIVTKLGGARRDDASWYAAMSPADLRLLEVDQVPVAHLRWIDNPDATFEAALATMIELREAGKIGAIGLSNVEQPQLATALTMTPVATVSNAYSVLDRTHDGLVVDCEREQIPFLPFFPLGASPVTSGEGVSGLDVLTEIAGRLGASPTQVAIAWLLARSPVMTPIPGTSSVAHLEGNIAAAELHLAEADLAALNAAA